MLGHSHQNIFPTHRLVGNQLVHMYYTPDLSQRDYSKDSCNTICVIEESAWWLLMALRLFDARVSATTVLTWPGRPITGASWCCGGLLLLVNDCIDAYTGAVRSSWLRPRVCLHRRHQMLSYWQPAVPPVMSGLPPRRLYVSRVYKVLLLMYTSFTELFSYDQAALWTVQSVRPSVRLSVTPFWLCSHHRIIMEFSGVITNDKSDVHAKGQGQRSKVKVTEVITQLNRFRTLTPVWIHIWWWNDAYSLKMLRKGALLFYKIIRQILRSHGSKKRRIWPKLGVSGL